MIEARPPLLGWRQVAATLLIVAAATAIRALFFGGLGRGIPYLTYYPAVMFAALYGGLFSGFVATAASAALCFWWTQRGVMSPVETLAMAVFLASCTIITYIAEAMHRARAEANAARDRAESANRAKSVFLSTMSHELRTPLNAILGFSRLMLDDAGESVEQRRKLEIINRSGAALLGLINNVLDVAKIESGRAAVVHSALDVRRLVTEVADLLRQRAEAKGLTLTLEVAGDLTRDLPLTIVTDAAKLRQVMLNLVGNAVKFTAQGGVTVRLATRPSGTAVGVTLIVEVADTGAGIAATDRQRIFEPFVQLGHKSDQEGTGLGLSISRQFVELMGGAIRVDSAPGEGSTFRVELPVEVAEASAVGAAELAGGPVERLAPGQPRIRVLVVDDKAENSELLRALLARTGFEVRVAENGAEAVAAFESWHPSFIWMDWRMPVMDGLEATRRIRGLEGGRDVKIVAISASVFNDEREQVMAAGADDFVSKPMQFPQVLACMVRLLGVRLVPDQSVPSAAAPPSAGVDPKALAMLPPLLRAELMDALVSLDDERIAVSIGRVAEQSPAAGDVLAYHARQFRYTIITRALQASQPVISTEGASS